MAITLLEKRKRSKFLISILVISILITVVIIWQGFLVEERPVLIEIPPEDFPGVFPEVTLKPVREIKIDFQILKSPELAELQPFEMPPFEEERGRKNPFLPY